MRIPSDGRRAIQMATDKMCQFLNFINNPMDIYSFDFSFVVLFNFYTYTDINFCFPFYFPE